MCNGRTKIKILNFPKGVHHHAKIDAQKTMKLKNYVYERLCYLGDCISLKSYKSVGDDEGGQASSSLAMIHTVGATKTLLKSLLKSPHLLFEAFERLAHSKDDLFLHLKDMHEPTGINTT